MRVDAEVTRMVTVNFKAVVALGVDHKADGGIDLDDVVNVEVLPSEMSVVSEISGDDILLDDLVQVEAVVNVVSDDDNGDDEAPLNEVCHVSVVISPVIDVLVGGDVISDGVSEPEVQMLLDVVDEDADDDGTDCECEC